MNNRHLVMTFAVCVLAAYTISSPAGELSPKPSAGATLTVQFEAMPPTFFAVHQKKDVKAQMTVFLPTNYAPDRKFPLLLLLGGGDGGAGNSLGIARSLSEGRDFVCVNVPLFKASDYKVDKPGVSGEGYIMRGEDAKVMWPQFRTMMEKLDEVVPNLDPSRQVLGGFSNGAHATAGLIDESDGEIARRFSAFLFVEGGGKLKHYELLKGKPFLMVSSNAKSLPRAKQICDTAKAAGAAATLVFEDVGQHDFPKSAYPAVRAWLRGPALRNEVQK